jgi:spore photoproduct lyase
MFIQRHDMFPRGRQHFIPPQKRHSSVHVVPNFSPDRIVLAKGSMDTHERRSCVERICSYFPRAEIDECLDTPHNRIVIDPGGGSISERHSKGKKTLVLGVMNSAVRLSDESGNTCPNYWHYSVFGFCPYHCSYCYLAGTTGVWHSPSVKIYVNLSEIIDTIDMQARKLSRPTSFYHGKLQDGLALGPITGYMQTLIPFFAQHPFARQIILTKSDAVHSLLSLDHCRNTILSWSLNPPVIAHRFEPDTPPIESRINAMKLCTDAGYPVRAVLMPIIPIAGWQDLYGDFLGHLLAEVHLDRLTIGGICSYSRADKLMEHHIGPDNTISRHMAQNRSRGDGRRRYSPDLRTDMYRFIVQTARGIRPELPIGLCLEESDIWRAVDPELRPGVCNCVL